MLIKIPLRSYFLLSTLDQQTNEQIIHPFTKNWAFSYLSATDFKKYNKIKEFGTLFLQTMQ